MSGVSSEGAPTRKAANMVASTAPTMTPKSIKTLRHLRISTALRLVRNTRAAVSIGVAQNESVENRAKAIWCAATHVTSGHLAALPCVDSSGSN